MKTPWTIAEWRKAHEEGIEVLLPSQTVVRVRPVNVSTFLRAGKIPDQLTPVVGRLINQAASGEPITSVDDVLAQMDLLDAFALTCIVSPRVVKDNPAENEISLDMLADVDKQFLFAFIGRPASELAVFRPEPADAVDHLVGEQGDAPTAE